MSQAEESEQRSRMEESLENEETLEPFRRSLDVFGMLYIYVSLCYDCQSVHLKGGDAIPAKRPGGRLGTVRWG